MGTAAEVCDGLAPGLMLEQAQEVESATPVPDGTKVDFEHRKWEKLGEGASAAGVEERQLGWETVFVVVLRAPAGPACERLTRRGREDTGTSFKRRHGVTETMIRVDSRGADVAAQRAASE